MTRPFAFWRIQPRKRIQYGKGYGSYCEIFKVRWKLFFQETRRLFDGHIGARHTSSALLKLTVHYE